MSDLTKNQIPIPKPPPFPPSAKTTPKANPVAKNVNQKSSEIKVIEQQHKSSTEIKVIEQQPKPSTEVKVIEKQPVKVNQQQPLPFGEVNFKPFKEQQPKSFPDVHVMEQQHTSSSEVKVNKEQSHSSGEVKINEQQPKSNATVEIVEQQSSGTNKTSTIRNRNSTPRLQSIHINTNNFNPDVNETIRKCFVVGQVRNSKNLVILGMDRQIMLLQPKPKQQVIIGEFLTILNVHYDITRASTDIKLVQADTIYKGKLFAINEQETKENIRSLNILLEGQGRDARELTKEEILERPDGAIVEKITLKANWVGSRIYNNLRTIHGLTENQVPYVVSLDTPHHEMIQQDKVYTFVKIQKVNNWKSTMPIINDVSAKFKTTSKSEIHRIDNPGSVFVEMGNEIGRVVLINQQLEFYDQCPECWRTRINQSCNQSNCSQKGIRMDKNQKFIAKFAVMTTDNKLVNYKVWSNQLVGLNTEVPDDELADVILLSELEDHFENKQICFKVRTDFNSDQDDKFITEVSIKQIQNVP